MTATYPVVTGVLCTGRRKGARTGRLARAVFVGAGRVELTTDGTARQTLCVGTGELGALARVVVSRIVANTDRSQAVFVRTTSVKTVVFRALGALKRSAPFFVTLTIGSLDWGVITESMWTAIVWAGSARALGAQHTVPSVQTNAARGGILIVVLGYIAVAARGSVTYVVGTKAQRVTTSRGNVDVTGRSAKQTARTRREWTRTECSFREALASRRQRAVCWNDTHTTLIFGVAVCGSAG